MVWKELFGCLESYSIMFDVYSSEEHNNSTFEYIARSLDQLRSLLIRTLIDWSRPWGFTHCNSIFDFQASLQLSV